MPYDLHERVHAGAGKAARMMSVAEAIQEGHVTLEKVTTLLTEPSGKETTREDYRAVLSHDCGLTLTHAAYEKGLRLLRESAMARPPPRRPAKGRTGAKVGTTPREP